MYCRNVSFALPFFYPVVSSLFCCPSFVHTRLQKCAITFGIPCRNNYSAQFLSGQGGLETGVTNVKSEVGPQTAVISHDAGSG